MVVENSQGETVRAFVFDEATDRVATEALAKAANILDEFHAMMRMEITDGAVQRWPPKDQMPVRPSGNHDHPSNPFAGTLLNMGSGAFCPAG